MNGEHSRDGETAGDDASYVDQAQPIHLPKSTLSMIPVETRPCISLLHGSLLFVFSHMATGRKS